MLCCFSDVEELHDLLDLPVPKPWSCSGPMAVVKEVPEGVF